MKKLLTLLSFVFTSFLASAQWAPIMVCDASGNNCTPYYNLDSAIFYSNAGNHIYIPGGAFNLTLPINKSLKIFGNGTHPDSTIDSGGPTILGTCNLQSDFISIEGVIFGGRVESGSAGSIAISNLNLKYCVCMLDWVTPTCNNSTFINCYFNALGSYNGGGNNLVDNCIIGILQDFDSSLIRNCIFQDSWYYPGYGQNYHPAITHMTGSMIQNSIFLSTQPVFYSGYNSNDTLSNCVYQNPGDSVSNKIQSNCFAFSSILDWPMQSLIPATNIPFPFTSETMIAMGTPAYNGGIGGSQMGIHSGAYPWGVIPTNPHISNVTVGTHVNQTGILSIHIQTRSGN